MERNAAVGPVAADHVRDLPGPLDDGGHVAANTARELVPAAETTAAGAIGLPAALESHALVVARTL